MKQEVDAVHGATGGLPASAYDACCGPACGRIRGVNL